MFDEVVRKAKKLIVFDYNEMKFKEVWKEVYIKKDYSLINEYIKKGAYNYENDNE